MAGKKKGFMVKGTSEHREKHEGKRKSRRKGRGRRK